MLKLLLLLWVFSYSETMHIHVMGKKGGSVTLPCEVKTRGIFYIRLNRQSKNILFYRNNCSKRVCKKGACDVIIKDLRLSDAGKYILDVYNKSVLKPQTRTYQLHIYDDVFVKTGQRLKLDVLLPDVHQVTHQNKSSTEWKEVWRRENKERVDVTHDRLNDSDGRIKEFTADDAGTYRVLDYEGEILITVTVTDESKIKRIYTDDEKKDNGWGLLDSAGLFVSAVFALLLLIRIYVIIRKINCPLHRPAKFGLCALVRFTD